MCVTFSSTLLKTANSEIGTQFLMQVLSHFLYSRFTSSFFFLVVNIEIIHIHVTTNYKLTFWIVQIFHSAIWSFHKLIKIPWRSSVQASIINLDVLVSSWTAQMSISFFFLIWHLISIFLKFWSLLTKICPSPLCRSFW